MGSFSNYWHNFEQQHYFETHYEEVSEPLKEYNVYDGGRLEETYTSETLLGVKKNGKWGWVDYNDRFVIEPIYDTGFITCYNGYVFLRKNGKWGGLRRSDFSKTFSFIYDYQSEVSDKVC